jgi:LCP family protein required for cell wall assembly
MSDLETLVRQAIAAEASQAVEPAAVLAGLQRGVRPRRRPTTALVAMVGLAVVAGVVAVAVPLTAARTRSDAGNTAPPAAAEQNILLVGMDGYDNTDSLVLARMGASGTLRAVSLPRDSAVDIPGHGVDRLNSAYRTAKAANHGSDTAGAEGLVATVEALTGVRIDHYAVLDMSGLDRLGTAVGGVEVCLRAASHDTITGADFPAGRQVLSGPALLNFVRQRHGLPNNDLDRIVRQQAVLRALAAKLADPAVHARLDTLVAVVRADIRTDPGLDLAGTLRRLASSTSVQAATIPVGTDPAAETRGMLAVDPAAVRAFVGDFLAAPPSAPATPSPGDVSCVN